MRRKEKSIESREELIEILRRGEVCFLAMADDGKPYVVPLNYGYKDNCLYFHSAPAGRKIEMIRKNPEVCFTVVPDHEVVRGESACSWTAVYRSVVGAGKARILNDRAGKEEGLTALMAQHSDRKFDFSGMGLDDVAVIRVEIETMEGKSSS